MRDPGTGSLTTHSGLVAHGATDQENQEVDLMPAPLTNGVEAIDVLEPSLELSLQPSCRDTAAHALTIVRDGVITGEGPTTKGRVHFSRALDADDAAWCARILTAAAVEHQPVSRAEAEALFQISDADTEVLEWIAGQMRGKRCINRTLMAMVATVVGAAVLPLAQLPNVFDI